MTLSTITLSTLDFISYASVEEADRLMLVDPVRGPRWATRTPDQKGAALVAATNRLDLFSYKGSKTGAPQPNQFPRTGIVDRDGVAVPDDEVPLDMANATIYLAGSIAAKPAAAGMNGSGSNNKRVKAGSAEVEFFKPTAGKPLADETAYALIQWYLASMVGAISAGGMASGTCEPPYDRTYGDLTQPYS